ncbi:PIN/TRAM domain-containing protein [Atopobacter phocae]|uniref:PIN/TRAM domain-containing protein n=1 Tax=Atopobacter phocae TaxID=136492 RepID=UPI00046F4A7D|nr:PIN/TRAM domain-containing protein [Atopobacter phocae]
MTRRIIRFIFVVIGSSLGITYMPEVWNWLKLANSPMNHWFINILVGAIIFIILSFLLMNQIIQLVRRVENAISKQSPLYLLLGSVGIIIGLLIATFISIGINSIEIPLVKQIVSPILFVVLGYLGFRTLTTRLEDFKKLFQMGRNKSVEVVQEDSVVLDRKVQDNFRQYKILDTSVIIDGRIYDILQSGFIEGTIVVPTFVLNELQLIADSSDTLKRSRGRRGLDILNQLQKDDQIKLEIYEGDYEDISEVDTKLIRLAKGIDGIVVTNDFNLNKVAEFQNVPVFNINALANAVKPVVIPGEMLKVMIVKNGTERQQGVAYLEDGTMIVVEEGQLHINETVDVVVTSALQTAAGRMIFAKLAPARKRIPEESSSIQ